MGAIVQHGHDGAIPTSQQEAPFGHVYAACGGIFIILSIVWGMAFDG